MCGILEQGFVIVLLEEAALPVANHSRLLLLLKACLVG